MKIGVLLPRSGEYPMIAIELMEGIRAGLREAGNDVPADFVSANIGFGESETLVYSEAERLLLTENADILLAYIDVRVIEMLEPLVMATGKILVVLNAGANMPAKKLPVPGIVYLTLQHSFLCRLAGRESRAENAVYATNFFDCGYMHGFAITDGFQSKGGQIVFNYVNQQKTDETFDISNLLNFLDNQRDHFPDLLCINDEAPAAKFYAALNTYEHADKLRLFVSPMMLTEKAIGEGNYRFSVTGYTNWLPFFDSEENKRMMLQLGRPLKNSHGIFLLSGYQSGLLLNTLLKEKQSLPYAEDLPALLSNMKIPSPGGELSYDLLTGYFVTDSVLRCSLAPGETKLMILKEQVGIEDWRAFSDSLPDGPTSGWINTYLCY